MKKLTIFFAVIGFSSSVFSYPITPRPLRKLITESEYIVWGKVLEVGSSKPGKKNENIWERDFAIIAITEKLQGTIQTDTIRVFFCSGMICPAPGVFYQDEQVLAFLDKREKKKDYEVHALSYGVKHGLNQPEYLAYKELIIEMQAILKKKDSKECSTEIIDWLVKCAEQKHTRWDAVYELSPTSDFMSYYDQDRDEFIRKDIYLTPGQRRDLFNLLLSIDTLEYGDMGLADITAGINDSVLLHFFKQHLIRIDTEYLWSAMDIMSRIVKLTGDKALKDLQEKFEKVYFGYSKDEKEEARKILADFIIKMKEIPLKFIPSASDEYST